MRRLLKCDPKKPAGAMLSVPGALALIVLFAFPAAGETFNTVSPDQPNAENAQVSGNGRAEVERLLNAGQALFQDHKDVEAIAAYGRAIDLYPQNARAFALRARAFSRKRDRAHALQDAAKAVALDPQLALGHKVLVF
jgi:tetratricopeptide (TPR) repeat protein